MELFEALVSIVRCVLSNHSTQQTFVMYVDRDRGAGVSLGVSDLTSDLKKKRKDEKVRLLTLHDLL